MALGSTQPPVKMSTRNIPGGKGGRFVRLTTSLPSWLSWKSRRLNLLEPSGPHRTCYGTPVLFGPGVNSACNRNEYQVYFLGVKAAGAYGWQPYHHPVPLSWNLGTLTSWNPLGHSRSVTRLLYLFYSSANFSSWFWLKGNSHKMFDVNMSTK